MCTMTIMKTMIYASRSPNRASSSMRAQQDLRNCNTRISACIHIHEQPSPETLL